MWVFYLISLPLTVGMVLFTLRYYAAPHVPRYVLLTVGYTWLSSLSIIILVPADIWTTISSNHDNGGISFFWSWSYWSTFLLTWAVVPLIQGFEDAGDFTVSERLKTSLHVNLIFYLIVGSIGLFGFILLIMMHKRWSGSLLGLAMACSNTFGLVTGAFLLGFGLSEIPKSIWRNADWTTRQKVLSHKIAKMAVRLDDAHQELSNAIVVAQDTSNQMSRRDPLRCYMDVIDDMLTQMFREDPSFKPQGGRLGESDIDYDTDEKSMATLRRHLRGATEEYYSVYMTYVLEALQLEDKIKNYERRNSTGWKYISSFRPARTGKFGSLCDTLEFFWQCILRKQVQKGLAVILGVMSVTILLAEATLLPSVDLSLFSILIKSVGTQEVLVQRMGNIDNAVPFFGDKFNRIYPLIMVIYTLLVASNFFDRVFDSLGSWKRYVFETETEDMDGFDPSGLIILQKERYWLEQGGNVGEQVVPLVRNFNGIDVESSDNIMFKQFTHFIADMVQVKNGVEMKGNSALVNKETDGNLPKTLKEETRRYSSSREAISSKYAAVRQQSELTSAKVSLLDHGNAHSSNAAGTSGLASTWQTMTTGFRSFGANLGGKGFLPIRQTQEAKMSRVSSSESLDDIFQRLKRPALDQNIDNDKDNLKRGNISGPSR
ncbi:hypothetical protein JHK85_021724 [Glycine max]|nr:hypothetical protein JHK85_021724 [Glycine max]